jgi:ribose transport system substrate-binding protein
LLELETQDNPIPSCNDPPVNTDPICRRDPLLFAVELFAGFDTIQFASAQLPAFPQIDAVFAINDPSAIGCDLAAKQAQRKEFFIVGVDGSPDIVPFLKDPASLIAATAAQGPYLMAQDACQDRLRHYRGKKPREELTLIPVGLITKGNVERYAGWSRLAPCL